MLVLRIAGVDLHQSAEAGPDLPHAVPAIYQGPVRWLAEGRILHHVLGALVERVGVLLIHGEDAHIGHLLSVCHQVVQSQAGGKFRLSVLLGDLIVQEAPVPDPISLVVLDLDAVKLPDQLLLPCLQLEWFARPSVLSEHQEGEKAQDPVHRLLAVPQFRTVVGLRHMDKRRQPDHLRHSGSHLRQSGAGTDCRPRNSAAPCQEPPGGTGW